MQSIHNFSVRLIAKSDSTSNISHQIGKQEIEKNVFFYAYFALRKNGTREKPSGQTYDNQNF